MLDDVHTVCCVVQYKTENLYEDKKVPGIRVWDPKEHVCQPLKKVLGIRVWGPKEDKWQPLKTAEDSWQLWEDQKHSWRHSKNISCFHHECLQNIGDFWHIFGTFLTMSGGQRRFLAHLRNIPDHVFMVDQGDFWHIFGTFLTMSGGPRRFLARLRNIPDHVCLVACLSFPMLISSSTHCLFDSLSVIYFVTLFDSLPVFV